MAYPSTITTLTNPQPTDRLNAPSHSAIEIAQNTEITALETFVGTTASTIGTLFYDVRSANSGGGGHVQAANVGGTGQTNYTKGDILAGQSTSVLSKLAVGTDGQILSADSTTQVGVKWINNVTPKIFTTASAVTLHGEANEASILSASVVGGTLGTSNAIRATAYVTDVNPRGSVLFRAVYQGGVSSVLFQGTSTTYVGRLTHTLIANGSNNQKSIFEVDLMQSFVNNGPSNSVLSAYVVATASVASGSNQLMGITFRESVSGDGCTVEGTIIEKIT